MWGVKLFWKMLIVFRYNKLILNDFFLVFFCGYDFIRVLWFVMIDSFLSVFKLVLVEDGNRVKGIFLEVLYR